MSIKISPFVFRLFSVIMLLTLLASAQGVTPAQAAGIRYAAPGGTGNCSTWANACTLQTALTGATIGDEIWVAAGAYKPTSGTDRTATFQLKSGVAVYGGFAGTETARDQRNPAINITILSGDIDNNDSQTPIITDLTTVTGNTTNSFHVVTGANNATLDGFNITAGNADEATGGGMYNSYSSPVLTNVTFRGNMAINWGGGIGNMNSNPKLTNVTFSGNAAPIGGGMYNYSSGPTLTNVTFSGNWAAFGGGIADTDSSSPTLTNVTFSGNTASNWAGGMSNWYASNPTLTNVTFNANSATNDGGGMFNYFSSPILTNVTFSANSTTSGSGGGINNTNSHPVLTNVTFSANSAANTGGGMSNYFSSPQIRNTVFWGNTAVAGGAQISNGENSTPNVSYSVIQDGYAGGVNIITADPMLDALGDYGGFTQVIPLSPGSSAIDQGHTALYPATDQLGIHRPLDGDGNGTRLCDIGAYEFPGATFVDVITTYWAWNWIERLYTASITGGCSTNPLMYCPETNVTRAQMAVFLLRGKHGSSYSPPAVGTSTGFTDVTPTYWAAAWIKQLAAEGITGGCSPNLYCPETSVTRDQMAVFLLRGKHGNTYIPPAATGVFDDAPLGYWAAAWIEALAAEGITGGCGGGNFCPATPVTRAQMAVFLVKTFNLP